MWDERGETLLKTAPQSPSGWGHHEGLGAGGAINGHIMLPVMEKISFRIKTFIVVLWQKQLSNSIGGEKT